MTKTKKTFTHSEFLKPIVYNPYNTDDDWYHNVAKLIKLEKDGVNINPVSYIPQPKIISYL